jgi:hypothetical protein
MAAPSPVQIQLPRLHAAQQRVIQGAKRFNIVCCGRRWGKSTLGVDRLIEPILKSFPCAWFSPSYKLLAECWRAIQDVLQPVVVSRNNAEFRLEIKGGGSVTMFSLDIDVADSVRGRAFKVIVIDEAALVRNLREVWENAIRPTLADHRGEAWFLSTPRGMNDFKLFFDRGQDPEREDWASWQMPTSTNPHITPAELAQARKDMTEAAFSQEFLAEFINWEGSVFRHVSECATASPQTKRMDGHTYAVGVDWGKSLDFTVFCAVDVTARAVVELNRSNQIDYILQRQRLQALCQRWKPSQVIVEMNSIGSPIAEELTRAGLPIVPFTTSNSTKAAVIEALSLAFEQRSIQILPDPILLSELQAFACEQLPSGLLRYSAPAGQHDDTVIALALAWSAVQDAGGFGLIEHLKWGQAELDAGRDPFAQLTAKVDNVSMLSTAKDGQCSCGHPGPPQRLATGAYRCAGCGAQWFAGGKGPATIAGRLSRADLQRREFLR